MMSLLSTWVPARAGALFRAGLERFRRRSCWLHGSQNEQLFEHAADAVYACDLSGRLVQANVRACECTGYTRQEILERNVIDIDVLTPTPEAFTAFVAKLKPGVPVTHETRHRRKDGSTFPVELRVVRIDEGEGSLLLGTARDISERLGQKLAYASMLDATLDAFWLVSPEGRLLDVNAAAANLLGYTVDEMLALSVHDIDADEDIDGVRARIATLQRTGQDRFEARHRHKSGHLIEVEVSVTMIPNESGNLVVFTRDVSKMRRAAHVLEARLRLIEFATGAHGTQELLRKFLDEAEQLTMSQIGFYHFVEEDQQTLSLQAWSSNTVTHMCKADGAGMHYPIAQAGVWTDCVHARAPIIHNDYASLAGKKGLPPGHAPIIRELVVPVFRAGRVVAILGVGNKERDYTEDDVAMIVQLADLAWDTVERMRAEEALRVSEAKFSKAFSSAPLLMMLNALDDGRLLEVNDAFVRTTGYSREQAIGTTPVSLGFVRAEDQARLSAMLEEDGGIREVEFPFVRSDGSVMLVLYSGELVEVSGEARLLSTAVDITSRKEAEQELARAYDLLENSNGAANIGYWEIALENMEVKWSRKTREIHEVPADFRCDVDAAVQFYQAGASRDTIARAVDRALTCGEPFDEELVIETARGNERWVRSIGLPTVLEGKCVRIYGLIQDITERKRSEVLLRVQQRTIALSSQIATVFLTSPPEAIYGDALAVVMQALESAFGLFGYIDEAGDLACPALSQGVWGAGQDALPTPSVFPRAHWGGIWGEAIASKRTVIASEGLRVPHGHVQLANAMATPILHRDVVIGLFIVANRKSGYGVGERDLLEGAAAQTGPVLSALLEKARKEREHALLEQQYRQAQKMEAIGQLTGGVAHDFNNLLQVINGYTELMLRHAGTDPELGGPLKEVAEAGGRAARLVSQLLLFSRRQVMCPETLDLNASVSNLISMLDRIIGEHVQLQWRPGPMPARIYADLGMVEQALTNLCVNARDAMPAGGTLTIETHNVVLDQAFCNGRVSAHPGPYVRLRVRDTGCGMDSHTIEHLFEPFYTTKELGKGTGLGLATVYGIVQQHGGIIDVRSVVGAGSTIEIYWPARPAEAVRAAPSAGKSRPRGGTETILLAEDDSAVRGLVQRMLEGAGYTVISAVNGEEAVSLFTAERERIDLVILDLVMPKMGGREAYDKMRAVRSDMKVFFASGYSEDAVHSDFVLDRGFTLLQKPYRYQVLLDTVRRVLDTDGATVHREAENGHAMQVGAERI